MKLSFDWLSDYVDLNGVSPQELAEKLTMGAFEVEEVTTVGAAIEGPLVIGEIIEIHQHPNADKIRLTKTRIAPGQDPVEIVCGAQNIEPGQIIPVALPGARVLDRKTGGPLFIKASAIRGVQSNGMLCSPSELGITVNGVSDPEAGILILDKATMQGKIGHDARELLSLKPDYVLHVEPRSNRGDAMSVCGLAREVAALLSRPLKQPLWSLDEFKQEKSTSAFHVSIEDPADCRFLTIRLFNGLKQKSLPEFITKRLTAIGVRSVSPIVDITNYVMHELGQPLHAYDAAKLEGSTIAVRRAKAGEILETLDGKKRELTNEMLVIADTKNVVGVAGVMGSKDSEISDSTTSIALEAASFAPARVRRASRLLGLSSDASLRFERGVDAAGVRNASNRAAYLIAKYCGADEPAVGEIYTAGSAEIEAKKVGLRLHQLKRMLGLEFTGKQVQELISPLGFSITINDEDNVTATVPSFRQSDVSREIDLVEEVCRLWGYDKLPVTMPSSTLAAIPQDQTFQRIKQTLCTWGFSEAWLSSLTSAVMSGSDDGCVSVLNPLSVEHQVLRRSLLPGLVQAAAFNYSRGRKKAWLFEIGRTYLRSEKSPWGTGVVEPNTLGAILVGSPNELNWQGNKDICDIYTVKGQLENILSLLRVDSEKIRYSQVLAGESETATNDGWQTKVFHPGKTFSITFSHKPPVLSDEKSAKPENQQAKSGEADKNGRGKRPNDEICLGYFGELHPQIADEQEIKVPVYMFEINLDLIKSLGKGRSFKETANTPTVQRDITADVPEHLAYTTIRSCILASAGQTLKDVELVSTFKLENGLKSLSFRLRLQHPEKTMTTEEIESLIQKIKSSLSKRLGVTYR
ncbi:MAG TPA: phenylalanine--tRNA ligase subunit beta [Oculatellaceae cyanobacterium]